MRHCALLKTRGEMKRECRRLLSNLHLYILPERSKRYGKQGLRLLLERAFRVGHSARLHNDFETVRDAAHHLRNAAGFIAMDPADGNIQPEITQEAYLRNRNT